MTVPQHPEKYGADAVIEPGELADPAAADVPRSVVLCYQPSLLEHVLDTRAGDELDVGHGIYDLHPIEGADGEIGVVGGFGVGAPVTAMVMEGLIAHGVETFLSVGWAGSLRPDLALNDVVVIDRALRDEGTSHHYLEPSRFVAADPSLVGALEGALEPGDGTVHVGATWTTDAPFRETAAEVERYAHEGILTVDMEAATTFAIAEYRRVAAGAAFVVSDYVGPEEWEPAFEDAREHLRELFDRAVDALD